jgi:hypothetical protein
MWDCDLTQSSWAFAINIFNVFVEGLAQVGPWKTFIQQMTILQERFYRSSKS